MKLALSAHSHLLLKRPLVAFAVVKAFRTAIEVVKTRDINCQASTIVTIGVARVKGRVAAF